MKKNKVSIKKTPTSYSISDESKELLKRIAESENRSMANMLETLIKAEAKAQKIYLSE